MTWSLPTIAPDPVRAEAIRARCHAHLARTRRRSERAARVALVTRRTVAPLVVGALSALYIAALVATALRLREMFE
jgi:hypothetical protein